MKRRSGGLPPFGMCLQLLHSHLSNGCFASTGGAFCLLLGEGHMLQACNIMTCFAPCACLLFIVCMHSWYVLIYCDCPQMVWRAKYHHSFFKKLCPPTALAVCHLHFDISRFCTQNSSTDSKCGVADCIASKQHSLSQRSYCTPV